MVFRFRADYGPTLNAGFVALQLKRDPDRYSLKTLYLYDFPGGWGGSGPPVPPPPLDPRMHIHKILDVKIVIIFLPISLTYILGAQKNGLIGMVLLSTVNLEIFEEFYF